MFCGMTSGGLGVGPGPGGRRRVGPAGRRAAAGVGPNGGRRGVPRLRHRRTVPAFRQRRTTVVLGATNGRSKRWRRRPGACGARASQRRTVPIGASHDPRFVADRIAAYWDVVNNVFQDSHLESGAWPLGLRDRGVDRWTRDRGIVGPWGGGAVGPTLGRWVAGSGLRAGGAPLDARAPILRALSAGPAGLVSRSPTLAISTPAETRCSTLTRTPPLP